ncbi:MAG: alpha/beta fold hydrolase, partial [Deltaproteobacteria bacterium]|nr:alpha/beta fold hydrolase [Deltaproteobacteria bacterium]
MRRNPLALVALLLAVLLLASACSVHRFQERRLTRRFAGVGLDPHTAELAGSTVHYWKGGQGGPNPVLLLHGFGGNALFTWHAQRTLAESHVLLVPDLLWFGGSSAEVEPSLQAQVDTFFALLDYEGAQIVDVVGISYGGLVAFQMVNEAPERFRRVVLVDTPGPTYTAADHAEMLERLGIESAAELVVPEGPEGVRRLIALAYHDPPAVPGFALKDVYRHMFADQAAEKRILIDELEGRTAEESVWSLGHPTLLVWGEQDELFPVGVAERLVVAIGPQAELHVISDGNHAPNIEYPEEFNAVVLEFLDREDAVAPEAPVASPPPVVVEAAPEPTFAFVADPLPDELRVAMTGVSWNPGCPVPLEDLRQLTVAHWGFDGEAHTGVLIVAAESADVFREVFRTAFEVRFPIERMEPVHRYGGDDDRSMAANNTSAFNCRPITGGTSWSQHTYGNAIDINPVQNPYVRGDRVLPPEGS